MIDNIAGQSQYSVFAWGIFKTQTLPRSESMGWKDKICNEQSIWIIQSWRLYMQIDTGAVSKNKEIVRRLHIKECQKHLHRSTSCNFLVFALQIDEYSLVVHIGLLHVCFDCTSCENVEDQSISANLMHLWPEVLVYYIYQNFRRRGRSQKGGIASPEALKLHFSPKT